MICVLPLAERDRDVERTEHHFLSVVAADILDLAFPGAILAVDAAVLVQVGSKGCEIAGRVESERYGTAL